MMSPQMDLLSHSSRETQDLGRVLGQESQAGDVFLLVGPLGAGKTCLTQGIAWGLGVQEYARSPTFVLVTRYHGRLTIHHVDLYRIEDPLETLDLGLEEYLGGEGVCVVEWADRTPQVFPRDSLWVELEYGDTEEERRLKFFSESSRYNSLLQRLKGR
jgi:tRNA threonylcarbamoyladenosine biosynthesis protein TsaE